MVKALTQSQAKAVYDALCALSNVGASLGNGAISLGGGLCFSIFEDGVCLITAKNKMVEEYKTPAVFADQYNL